MSRLPPGRSTSSWLQPERLALGVGAVATIDGNLWGLPLALGGAVLLIWSLMGLEEGVSTSNGRR